mmetsp:Transcript_45989/g.80402  ORF Transcript_45989/g.80402 Transcript_45989/m.80402 type:complete len:344 (-) Transcript_45989:2239-3270(-)
MVLQEDGVHRQGSALLVQADNDLSGHGVHERPEQRAAAVSFGIPIFPRGGSISVTATLSGCCCCGVGSGGGADADGGDQGHVRVQELEQHRVVAQNGVRHMHRILCGGVCHVHDALVTGVEERAGGGTHRHAAQTQVGMRNSRMGGGGCGDITQWSAKFFIGAAGGRLVHRELSGRFIDRVHVDGSVGVNGSVLVVHHGHQGDIGGTGRRGGVQNGVRRVGVGSDGGHSKGCAQYTTRTFCSRGFRAHRVPLYRHFLLHRRGRRGRRWQERVGAGTVSRAYLGQHRSSSSRSEGAHVPEVRSARGSAQDHQHTVARGGVVHCCIVIGRGAAAGAEPSSRRHSG